jgi:hypothetical protein
MPKPPAARYHRIVSDERDSLLAMDDDTLLKRCRQDVYKSSGPGGQHRNKVSSAVRLHHAESGITAHGDDSRSQHENRRLALMRLRMNLALQLRKPVELGASGPPPALRACMFIARGGENAGRQRLEVGRKDARFWGVAAVLLDALEAFEGRLGDAAAWIGISTGNFVALLESDRHLLGAAQAIRKSHGHKPLQ